MVHAALCWQDLEPLACCRPAARRHGTYVNAAPDSLDTQLCLRPDRAYFQLQRLAAKSCCATMISPWQACRQTGHVCYICMSPEHLAAVGELVAVLVTGL